MFDEGIPDLIDHPAPVGGIDQHPIHPEEGSVLTIKQGGDAVMQNVGHPGTPRITPNRLEGIHDAGGDKGAVVGWDVGERIEGNGKVEITRVEVNQMICPMGRQVMQEFLREVTMGIDNGNPVALLDVLEDEVPQQSGFSRTRFPNDVSVKTRILRMDDEGDFPAPNGAVTNDEGVI